jgi:hypothetical protein
LWVANGSLPLPFTLFTSRTCKSLCAAQNENDYRVLSQTTYMLPTVISR